MADTFFFPHTIKVRRPPSAVTKGLGQYGDLTRDEETEVLQDIPAGIQLKGPTGSTTAHLPGGTRQSTTWRILIPLKDLPDQTAIRTRDIIVDEMGRRFQVTGAYMGSMGWNINGELLEI